MSIILRTLDVKVLLAATALIGYILSGLYISSSLIIPTNVLLWFGG
jgi:hypothetical protein